MVEVFRKLLNKLVPFREVSILLGDAEILIRDKSWAYMRFVLFRETYMEGGPGAVEFDADFAFKRFWSHKDIAGVYHTHPPFSTPRYSPTDHRTGIEWARTFGRPFVMVIRSGRKWGAYAMVSGGGAWHGEVIQFSDDDVTVKFPIQVIYDIDLYPRTGTSRS